MPSGIYRIENAANGRSYVGSAVHLVNRWASHRRGLRKGEHRNRYLQRAWDKYGEAAFRFIVLEDVADVAELVPREQTHIDAFARLGKLYNLSPTAGSNLGTRRTAETKARMSAAQMGLRPGAEARAAMSAAQKASNAQRPELLAMRAKQLVSARRAIDRDKQRAAAGKASRDRIWSVESRAKLCAAKLGVRISDVAIARMAAAKCKPVKCVTTGRSYSSVLVAGKACGVHYSSISKVCLGNRKTAGGLVFIFVK